MKEMLSEKQYAKLEEFMSDLMNYSETTGLEQVKGWFDYFIQHSDINLPRDIQRFISNLMANMLDMKRALYAHRELISLLEERNVGVRVKGSGRAVELHNRHGSKLTGLAYHSPGEDKDNCLIHLNISKSDAAYYFDL